MAIATFGGTVYWVPRGIVNNHGQARSLYFTSLGNAATGAPGGLFRLVP